MVTIAAIQIYISLHRLMLMIFRVGRAKLIPYAIYTFVNEYSKEQNRVTPNL